MLVTALRRQLRQALLEIGRGVKCAMTVEGIIALCELGLGVALVWGSRLPSNRVAELLGGVAVLTILQLIPMLFYREVPRKTELEAN
jgi:hypothetical protein